MRYYSISERFLSFTSVYPPSVTQWGLWDPVSITPLVPVVGHVGRGLLGIFAARITTHRCLIYGRNSWAYHRRRLPSHLRRSASACASSSMCFCGLRLRDYVREEFGHSIPSSLADQHGVTPVNERTRRSCSQDSAIVRSRPCTLGVCVVPCTVPLPAS